MNSAVDREAAAGQRQSNPGERAGVRGAVENRGLLDAVRMCSKKLRVSQTTKGTTMSISTRMTALYVSSQRSCEKKMSSGIRTTIAGSIRTVRRREPAPARPEPRDRVGGEATDPGPPGCPQC